MKLDPELWTHYVYICDHCHGYIAHNAPVIIDGDFHLCSPDCYTKWEEQHVVVSRTTLSALVADDG